MAGSNSKLFVISESSIYAHDIESDKFKRLNITFPGNTGKVIPLSLSFSAEGKLLMGTKDHGLYLVEASFNDDNLYHASRLSNDLSVTSSSIYAIQRDSSDQLWMSTDFGLASLNKEGELLYRFNVEDGLQGNDFNFGAHLIRSDGRMLFGGPNGYNQFDPATVEVKSKSVRVTIPYVGLGNGVGLNHIELLTLENIQIDSATYSVSFQLGVSDFTNTLANQYTYKLDGFNNSWVEAGTNNTATYTNLEPGEYTFRARGANAAGIWSENEVSLHIVVLPPWWMTWWAYAAYGLLAILCFWVIMRVYRNHLLKEEALRIAQQMHDAADQAQDDLQENQEYQDELVRAVSQHNLATLELISQCFGEGVSEESSPAKVLGHIKALELLEKSYFFEENSLVADMHAYVDGLINFLLTQTDVDPSTITTINRVTSETLPARIASPLAIIIYELLHNTLAHAFSADSLSNFVEVSLEISRDSSDLPTLALVVSDDGIGIPASPAKENHVGSGLRVVRELAEVLGADCTIISEGGHKTQINLHMSGPLN